VIRKLVPVLALALVALAAVAIGAAAHKKTYSSDVTARITDPRAEDLVVSGAVTSPQRACLKGRTVIATTFSKEKRETETIGSAVTDATGAYQFTLDKGASAKSPIALVEVRQKRISPKTRKHKHVCGMGSTALPLP
jgi:hypothetical protein